MCLLDARLKHGNDRREKLGLNPSMTVIKTSPAITERVLDQGNHKGDIRVKPEYDREEAERNKGEKIILSFPCLESIVGENEL